MLDTIERVVIAPDIESPAKTSSEVEEELADDIKRLWGQQREAKAFAQKSREELKAIRLALGERLQEMKGLLGRTGRGGQWASYLRATGLASTSADRYIAGYVATIHPPEKNGPTGVIPEPTEDEIAQFIKQIMPKLRKGLTTQDAVWSLLCELVELPSSDAEWTESGVLFHRPSPASPESEHLELVIPEPAASIQ